MINKHVNDDEIQQYVLQKADCGIDIIEHIRSCETCKIKLIQKGHHRCCWMSCGRNLRQGNHQQLV